MVRRLSLLAVLTVGGMVLAPGVAAGGGCLPDAGAEMTSSSKRTVKIGECAFYATVTYVEPGDKVRWINGEHVPHTVTGAAKSWGTEDILETGDSVSYAFEEEGVYPYYCALHPSMVGAVVVGDGGGPSGTTGFGVKAVDDSAPASSTQSSPIDTDDGLSPAVLALAVAAALGAVFAGTRYALGRRASAPSAS